jgi:pyruvate/2-oxoglutarate dehydrogenase complex dihydrolipoamide acyltransferase (E2) component
VLPLARALADAHGVDLRTVVGRGRGGRIEEADVLEALRGAAADDGPALLDAEDLSRGLALLDETDL